MEKEDLDFKWDYEPNVDNLKKFLCDEKGFAESRIENGLKKISKVNF